LGEKKVSMYIIGREPSGQSFNEFGLNLRRPSAINPMINAGAMMSCGPYYREKNNTSIDLTRLTRTCEKALCGGKSVSLTFRLSL